MLNRWPILALMLVLAVTAQAQRKGPPSPTGQWKLRLDESSTLLMRGDYDASLKISERLIRQMIQQLGSGEGAVLIFGLAVTHKALALAGLGREEDALWYWHTVVTLYPSFAKSDLSKFGEAGAFLDRHRDARAPAATDEPQYDIADVHASPPGHVPPKLRRRVEPEFPNGAYILGATGQVIVEVLITKEGTVTAPRVLQALRAPTLTYVALEALRQWRFEPARKDGKPVEEIFRLTVNYIFSDS